MLLDGNGIVTIQESSSHNGFLAVNPRRDEGRKSIGNVFALLAHSMESIDGALGLAADFTAYVPASETLVFTSVHFPDLVDNELVGLDFVRHIACIPILSGVIETEPELHVILLGQTQEHVDEVHRRHIAAFLEKIWRRIRDELAIAGTYTNNRIDTDRFHITEIRIPLLFSPVLVRNVVRDFI